MMCPKSPLSVNQKLRKRIIFLGLPTRSQAQSTRSLDGATWSGSNRRLRFARYRRGRLHARGDGGGRAIDRRGSSGASRSLTSSRKLPRRGGQIPGGARATRERINPAADSYDPVPL